MLTMNKNSLFMTFFMMLCSSMVFSKGGLLIPYEENLTINHAARVSSLQSDLGGDVHGYFRVNTSKFSEGQVSIGINGINYNVIGGYHGKVATRYSWIGTGHHGTVRVAAIYTGTDANIAITIFGDNVYKLSPIGDGVHVLLTETVDLSENCELTEEDLLLFEEEAEDEVIAFPENSLLNNSNDPHCALRIGMAYTWEALEAMGWNFDVMFNAVCERILQTNEVYGDSHGKDHMVTELAFLRMMPDYSEESMKKDLKRFRRQGDDDMNEIHSSRHVFKADYCGLVRSEGGGRASGIGVGYSKGFFAIGNNRLIGSGWFTFTHELGHLHSCWHSHGKRESAIPGHNGWRTIMKYSKEGCGCPRIPFHSSSSQTWPHPTLGNISLGNWFRDCIEQIEGAWQNKVNFEKVVVSGGIIDHNTTFGDMVNIIYADLLAMDYFVVLGQSNLISWGYHRTIRAGKAITIETVPNSTTANTVFEAAPGSVVDIFIKEDVANGSGDCIPVNPHPQRLQNDKEDVKEEIASQDSSIKLFPNPTRDLLNVEFELEEDEVVRSVNIFDARGGLILGGLSEQLDAEKTLNVSQLNTGLYILVIDTDKRRLTNSFVVSD